MSNAHHIHGDLGDQTAGYDSDFNYPHLDPPELNDLPVEAKYVGVDKPVVEHHRVDQELEGYGEIPF